MNAPQITPSGWTATLDLRFSKSLHKTFLSEKRHKGPLVVQRAFYPEGDLCHLYILHPPGGVVGGDELTINVAVDSRANALITTPGASKIYRALGQKRAKITQNITLAADSSLEWLPMETINFAGAQSDFFSRFSLLGNAKIAAWEVQCLGRPVMSEAFDSGDLSLNFELWRDGIPLVIDRLIVNPSVLNDAVGLRGYPVFGTFIISHTDDKILDLVREKILNHADYLAAATQIEDILLVRCLSRHSHLIFDLFSQIWQAIRPQVFAREPVLPRIWAT